MSLASLNFVLSANIDDFQTKMRVAQKSFEKFGKDMQQMGQKMSTFVTVPVLAAAGASIKFASDYNESLNKIDVAFKENAQGVKDWSKNSIQQFGMASGTALDMAALFGDMATGMGLNTKEAASMSTKLVGLAGDMASFKNVSSDIAATALKSIFTGETESLKNLGVVMTEANLKAFALSEGITKNYKDFTEAEKVQLRYQFVLEKTKNSQGDFERTNGGAANQMRIFQESLKNLGQSFGQIILPAFTNLVQKLNGAIQWFGNLDESTKKTIVIIAGLAAAIGPLMMGIGAVSNGMGALIGGFKMFATAIPAISAFIMANPFMLLVAGIVAATTAIIALNGGFKGVLDTDAEIRNRARQDSKKQSVLKGLDEIKGISASLQSKGMDKATADERARVLYAKSMVNTIKGYYNEAAILEKQIEKAQNNGLIAVADGMNQRRKNVLQMAKDMDFERINVLKTTAVRKEDASQQTEQNIVITETIGLLGSYTNKIEELKKKQEASMNPAEIKNYQDRIDYYEKQTEAVRNFGQTLEQMQNQSISPMKSKTATEVTPTNTDGKQKSEYGSWLPTKLEISETSAAINQIIDDSVDKIDEASAAVNSSLSNLVNSSLTGFGTWLGNLFSGATGFDSFLNKILSSLADFAVQMGTQLIAVGIGAEAFKAALGSLNGIGAIIAGVALVATGTAFKALMAQGPALPKMAKGGIIPSGFGNDTYPAMLSSGEMVIPKPIALGGNFGVGNGKQYLYSRVSGNDIFLSNTRTMRNRDRFV